jgi:hypothetical protein
MSDAQVVEVLYVKTPGMGDDAEDRNILTITFMDC